MFGEAKPNQKSFLLCMSAESANDGTKAKEWLNRGPFSLAIDMKDEEEMFRSLTNTLSGCWPTKHRVRPFYIWPGYDSHLDIKGPAELSARLYMLLLNKQKWAHISLTPGLTRHVNTTEFAEMYANSSEHTITGNLTQPDPKQPNPPHQLEPKPLESSKREDNAEKSKPNNVGSGQDDDLIEIAPPPSKLKAIVPSQVLTNTAKMSGELATAVQKKKKVTGCDDDNEDEEQDYETRMKNEEDELNAEMKSREVLATQMQAAVVDKGTVKQMERIDESRWMQACNFFGVKEADFRAGLPISLKDGYFDLSQPFSPAQLHEAYELYNQELTSINGGILANMMGMGKTRTMVLLLVIGHIHLVNYLEVKDEQKTKSEPESEKRHLSNGIKGQKCPTHDQRPFNCACESGSLFSYPPRCAPTILTGAGKSKDAWRKEICDNVLGSRWCDPKQTSPALRVCWMLKGNLPKEFRSKMLDPPTSGEIREMQCASDFDTPLETFCQKNSKHTYIKNKTQHVQELEWEYATEPENLISALERRPPPTSGRFILITSKDQAVSHWKRFSITERTIRTNMMKNGRMTEEKRSLKISAPFVVGRTIMDEFHLAKSKDTSMGKLYQELQTSKNKGYQWKSWALSGTPLEAGLAEVLTFVSLALPGVEHNESGHGNWKTKKGEWKDSIYEDIADRGLTYAADWMSLVAKCGTTDESVQNTINSETYKKLTQLGPRILKKWVLWRTWESRDPWGNSVGGIDSVFSTYFRPCRSKANHEETMKVLRNRIAKTTPGDKLAEFPFHLRTAFASFPHLAVLMASAREQGDTNSLLATLESTGIRALATIADKFLDKGNPFQPHLDDLASTSAKYVMVEKECESIRQERMKADEGDAKKNSKIIVGSCRPICQMILYLCLVKKYGKSAVTYLPGNLSAEDSYARREEWKSEKGPWILVVSVAAYGESVTFVEAHKLIMFEPQTRLSQQQQFAFRIFRKGQKFPHCTGMVLYNPEAEIEQTLLQKQLIKTRARIELGSSAEEAAVIMSSKTWNWESNEDIQWLIPGVAAPASLK